MTHPRRAAAIRSANIPARFHGRTLQTLQVDSSTHSTISDWLDSLRDGEILQAEGQDNCGLGLRLYGAPGHGKTTLACAVLQTIAMTTEDRRLLEHRALYYIRYPQLIATMKQEMSNDEDATLLLDQLGARRKTVEPTKVLVLDDLGKEYKTEWSESTVDHILRARYDAGFPTIVTTNAEPSKWATLYGEATASFAHEAFVDLAILNPSGDRRR